jgi:hypothetical protein
VEDSDDAPFTHHTFVFFGGDEVGETLAGVFLISTFFAPLSFADWLRLLGLVVPVECFQLGWGYLIFLLMVRNFSIDHSYM